jgi:hypothetical protein
MHPATSTIGIKDWNGAHQEQRQHWLDIGVRLDDSGAAALDCYIHVQRGNWLRGVRFIKPKDGVTAVTHNGTTIAELSDGRDNYIHAWLGAGSARSKAHWLGIYTSWVKAMPVIWSAAELTCPPMTPEAEKAFLDAAGPRRRQDMAMSVRCRPTRV